MTNQSLSGTRSDISLGVGFSSGGLLAAHLDDLLGLSSPQSRHKVSAEAVRRDCDVSHAYSQPGRHRQSLELFSHTVHRHRL